MKPKIKKSTIWLLLSIFLYRIILDISYYFVISPIWKYERFVFNPNYFKLFESFFLLFVIFTLIPKSKEKLSSLMVWILILISYVPMLTLFALKNESRIFMYAVTGFWLLVFLLLKFPSISIISLRKKQSKIILYSIFVALFVVTISMIYKNFNLSLNITLTNEYEIRKLFINLKTPLMGYLSIWVACVINPVFFILFLNKKKWPLTIPIIFLQLLLFSITGNKIFLFALPFALGLLLIIKSKKPLFYFSMGLVIIITLSMFSYLLLNDVWMSSLFTRRTLLVPAQLSFLYYNFFSKSEPIFLSSHKIFQNLINYPYQLNPPHLIGKIYFNRPEMAANNGIYGDAYMNFGFIGFFFWGLLLTFILKFADIISKNKETGIALAAIAMSTISLTNGALLTSFLTHGLLLSLLILYLLPKKEKINKKNA